MRHLHPRFLPALLALSAACGAGEATPAPHTTPEEPAPMMVIRVVIDVVPAQRDAFVAYLTEEAERVREMDGCERYALYGDATEDNRFLLYEEWASAEAVDAYRTSDALRQSFTVLGPMMARPPDSAYFAAAPQPTS